MTESSSHRKTTRRDALKLAGAAALGAAGTAALGGAPRVRAAGSGNTIDMYFTPQRTLDTRGSAKIGHGTETVVGPYTVPGGGFSWTDSYGIIGNITAVGWTGAGWLSIRQGETTWDPTTGVSNINFSGPSGAIANFFICRFGSTTIPLGGVSDGQIIVRSGGATTNFIIDLFGFLGPDQ
jgi:hypothetical protein